MSDTRTDLDAVDWDDVPDTPYGADPAYDELAGRDCAADTEHDAYRAQFPADPTYGARPEQTAPEASAVLLLIAHHRADLARHEEAGLVLRAQRARYRIEGLLAALGEIAAARYSVTPDSDQYLTVYRVKDRWTGHTVDSFTGGISAAARADRLAADQNRCNRVDVLALTEQ